MTDTATTPIPAGPVKRLVRLGVDDLKAIAGARCCDIYDDFTEDEAKRQTTNVYEAWKVGRDIRALSEPNAESSGGTQSIL